MDKNSVFLNNNTGNVVLVPGNVYQVSFQPNGRWPAFNTILEFIVHTRWDGGYVFRVIDRKHQDILRKVQGSPTGESISYRRDELRSAKFKSSTALNVLYGQIKKDPQP